MQVIAQPEIRAACIQVLFSAVYHLKSAVLPYSSKLLKLSLKALKEGSERVVKPSSHLKFYHTYRVLVLCSSILYEIVAN